MWNMMFCQQKALFSLGFMIAERLCSDKNSLRAFWLTWWNRWSVQLLAHINRYSDAQGPVNALAQKPLKSYFCCGRKFFIYLFFFSCTQGPRRFPKPFFFFFSVCACFFATLSCFYTATLMTLNYVWTLCSALTFFPSPATQTVCIKCLQSVIFQIDRVSIIK